MTDEAPPARRQLPTTAEGLAPMGEAFEAALEDGLAELGLLGTGAASEPARRSYAAHARLLRAWNSAINLTAVRDPAGVATRHVCDSLTAVAPLGHLVAPNRSLLDLGSGGGYPGLPLAAALRPARVGLVDSVQKKARFLAVAAAAVASALDDEAGVPDIEAIAERAEDLADEPEHRAGWDLVVARAVGSLAEVLELGLPLTSEAGLVIAWKRDDGRGGLDAELRAAGSIVRAAGGGRPEIVDVSTGSLPGHRLVVVRKERPSPIDYPRPASVRRKRPR